MGRWTRDVLEQAFANYQAVALRAGTTGDWNAWADLFTEDATYVEHAFGTFGGREAIRRWITTTMSTFPGNAMPHFPIDWYVIDEERGWVVCQISNRMADPGDGSVHVLPNAQVLMGCYHPSRQNTNTGRLTPRMMDDVFRAAKRRLARFK